MTSHQIPLNENPHPSTKPGQVQTPAIPSAFTGTYSVSSVWIASLWWESPRIKTGYWALA
jgi:hypothetical protein